MLLKDCTLYPFKSVKCFKIGSILLKFDSHHKIKALRIWRDVASLGLIRLSPSTIKLISGTSALTHSSNLERSPSLT